MDLTGDASDMWLEDADDLHDSQIVVSPRIGIGGGAGSESVGKPYRFYERDNEHVSVLAESDKKRRADEKQSVKRRKHE